MGKVKANFSNEQAVNMYNKTAPGHSFAMTLGNQIVLTSEEGDVQFIDKWELLTHINIHHSIQKGDRNG